MKLHFDRALLAGGWADAVIIEIDQRGMISSIASGASADATHHFDGVAIPGMANLHSHAFQRAMAGLAETGSASENSFWTWRELMYRFLERMSPDDVEAIAAQLYVEMLRAGYTAVGEFHYLHHSPDGTPYANAAEMSERILAAARQTGIAITHLPVLYAHSNFGGVPPNPAHRRFVNNEESLVKLVTSLRARYSNEPLMRIGVAPHSLRAVTPELLASVVEQIRDVDASAPIHIHVAEQPKEVEDCIAWCGMRPVEWLLRRHQVDERWCLVHATHMTPSEIQALAASAATAGLCPTTEANLGDGLFPAKAYFDIGGMFGIGSDSHIGVSVAEELRWLEYGQRIDRGQRNVLSGGAGCGTGKWLYCQAAVGGARALAQPMGQIATGLRADIVVLDSDNPSLYARIGDSLLDSFVFAGHSSPIREVLVGGRRVIADGHHSNEENIERNYRAALARLLN